jgi:hypothetical protein
MDDAAAKNTDREIWREVDGDYCSPSIHVTESGGIGIAVSGRVIVKSAREWHDLAIPSPPGTETGIPIYASHDATDDVIGKDG